MLQPEEIAQAIEAVRSARAQGAISGPDDVIDQLVAAAAMLKDVHSFEWVGTSEAGWDTIRLERRAGAWLIGWRMTEEWNFERGEWADAEWDDDADATREQRRCADLHKAYRVAVDLDQARKK